MSRSKWCGPAATRSAAISSMRAPAARASCRRLALSCPDPCAAIKTALSQKADIAPNRHSFVQRDGVPMAECVLVVDDDPVQRRLLENMVRKCGYDAVVAEGGDEAARLLAGSERRFDCVVLDLVMPNLDGLGLLARMREEGNATPVIVQTAHGGIDNVISAMRAGAVDFVVKPVGAERLQVSIKNALTTSALAGELQRLKRSRNGTLSFKDIVTRSSLMRSVLRNAEKAASSQIPVLIEGESGVGKELVAR